MRTKKALNREPALLSLRPKHKHIFIQACIIHQRTNTHTTPGSAPSSQCQLFGPPPHVRDRATSACTTTCALLYNKAPTLSSSLSPFVSNDSMRERTQTHTHTHAESRIRCYRSSLLPPPPQVGPHELREYYVCGCASAPADPNTLQYTRVGVP